MWCNLGERRKFIFFLIGPDRAINNVDKKGGFKNPFTITTTSADKWRANAFSRGSNIVQISPELVTHWKDE